jgi:hypothetical protein
LHIFSSHNSLPNNKILLAKIFDWSSKILEDIHSLLTQNVGSLN